MDKDVLAPECGAGIEEVEISEWFVKVGEEVTKGMLLGELLADKASVEVHAECDGTVAEILKAEGSVVKVGEAIMRIRCRA